MAFKNKDIIAMQKMYGEEHERQMPHPLLHCGSDMMHSEGWNKMRQMNSPGTVGNDASYKKAEKMRTTHPVKQGHDKNVFNALEALNLSGNYRGNTNQPIGAITQQPPMIPGFDMSKNLPTPGNMNYGSFGSGSYTNPQNTTNSNANDNSTTTPAYSFMEDENLNKDMGEHRNKFGFWKRNEESLNARIKDAAAKGKKAKEARLKKKLKNFQDNQKARAEGGLLDKINPKNWL
tara:strand:- start:41 stop:739 length:699 start_codon:yes stop_codon:yes gene_type:complete